MRSTWTLPLVALALTGLAACGGKDGDGDDVASLTSGKPSASATATASLSPEDARQKFEQCMRDAGIEVKKSKDGKGMMFGGKKGDKGVSEDAMKKCQSFLQQGGVMPDANDPAIRDKLVKFAQCMREHGMDMEDPDASGAIKMKAPAKGGKGDPKDDPKVQAAQKACEHLMPQRPGDDKPAS